MRVHVLGDQATIDWVGRVAGDRVTITSSPSDASCLVVSEGDRVPAEAHPRFVIDVVAADHAASLEDGSDSVPRGLVVRGPHQDEALARALAVARRLEEAFRLHTVICSPFSHDFRGVLSVVQLAFQIAERSPDTSALGQKLQSASYRLQALLLDLRFAARVRTADGSEVESSSFTASVTDLKEWMEVAHRRRDLRVEVAAHLCERSAPANFSLVLRGAVDAVARLTPSSEPISLRVSEGEGALLVAAQAPCGEPSDELTALLGTPADDWNLSGLPGSVFRFVSAQLLARARGGRASLDREQAPSGGHLLVASVQLPA
jgi:hypothetical protein